MCLGIPGQVIEVISQSSAYVQVSGVKRMVDITCVHMPNQNLEGQWVLVHVGFAMSIIDSEEAQATLRLLEQIGELQEDQVAYEQSLQDNDPIKELTAGKVNVG